MLPERSGRATGERSSRTRDDPSKFVAGIASVRARRPDRLGFPTFLSSASVPTAPIHPAASDPSRISARPSRGVGPLNRAYGPDRTEGSTNASKRWWRRPVGAPSTCLMPRHAAEEPGRGTAAARGPRPARGRRTLTPLRPCRARLQDPAETPSPRRPRRSGRMNLYALMFAHWVGDFVLQCRWMATTRARASGRSGLTSPSLPPRSWSPVSSWGRAQG